MRYILLGLMGSFMLTVASVPTQSVPTFPELEAATSTDMSYNWAGYVAQGQGPYSDVSGSWVVPTVVVGSAVGADATWIGVGGVRNQDLLQIGTQAIATPDGTVTYQSWLEMIPAASRQLPLEVRPGDIVAASLHETSPDVWEAQIENKTTGERYREQLTYDSSRSSAEWIEEMPSVARGGYIPLSNFGKIGFISGPTGEARPLHMVNWRGDVLAQTSVLSNSGSFVVTRSDAPALPRGRRTRYALPL